LPNNDLEYVSQHFLETISLIWLGSKKLFITFAPKLKV